jgi:tetratricopeptide (TPR) repeat protein
MLPLFIVAFSWLNFWRVQPQFAGVRAANQGDYHTAAALLEEATRRDPNLAVIHSQLALVYNRLGDLDRSIPAMQRSLELDPDWAPNHANLGLLYWKKGDLERAGRAFNEASVRAPGFYLYPYWFASVAEESNHPLDARIAYTHALELYPELPDRPVWKATPLQLEALSAWQAAHPVGTSITIAQLEALVAANPASMHLLLKLTDRYLQDGRLDEAEALLKKGHRLVTVTIEHYDLRQREAYLAAARGDTATAESILAEIRSAKGEIGAFGPGTGPSSYVPFVFRRAGLQFEVVE